MQRRAKLIEETPPLSGRGGHASGATDYEMTSMMTREAEDDDANDEENAADSGSPLIQSRNAGSSIKGIITSILGSGALILNIGAWYFTNSMNGVEMQSFSKTVIRSLRQDNIGQHAFLLFIITTVITALQLLLGALMGGVMLWVLQRTTTSHEQMNGSPIQSFLNAISELRSTLCRLNPSLLHTIGSLCTNLGFMSGPASLVQIIKLLEPCLTMVWTRLLLQGLPEARQAHSLGVICSMTLTVGAAMSLVLGRARSKAAGFQEQHVESMLFALLSGLTLSSRNVLQRRQHAAAAASNMNAVLPSKETSVASGKKTSNSGKLQQALIQFTGISLRSGLVLALFATVLQIAAAFVEAGMSSSKLAASPTTLYNLFLVPTQTAQGDTGAPQLAVWSSWWRVLIWHPLYNVFSMITLAWCSALTHSLLNAGKRIVAIATAMLWFSDTEDLSYKTVTSLVTVTLGGCWYSVETKKSKNQAPDGSSKEHSETKLQTMISESIRPFLVAVALGCLFYIHMQ